MKIFITLIAIVYSLHSFSALLSNNTHIAINQLALPLSNGDTVYFYTSQKSAPNFNNQGAAFFASSQNIPSTVPVYLSTKRIKWNNLQLYKYSISKKNQDGFSNPQIYFYAYPNKNSGGIPVYQWSKVLSDKKNRIYYYSTQKVNSNAKPVFYVMSPGTAHPPGVKSTRVGSRSVPQDKTLITSFANFINNNGVEKPIRYVDFGLYDKSNNLIALSSLNKYGQGQLEVQNKYLNQKFTVRITFKSGSHFNFYDSEIDRLNSESSYYNFPGTSIDSNNTINVLIKSCSDCVVLDNLVDYRDLASQAASMHFPAIDVIFPAITKTSEFDMSGKDPTLHIIDEDKNLPDIIAHEYGHVVMYNLYKTDMPIQNAPRNNDYTCPDVNKKAPNPAYGWSEGFATFFALVVTGSKDGKLDIGDTTLDYEHYDCDYKKLEHDQGRVVAALWDLYDENNDNNTINGSINTSYGRTKYNDTQAPHHRIEFSQILNTLKMGTQDSFRQFYEDLETTMRVDQKSSAANIMLFNYGADVFLLLQESKLCGGQSKTSCPHPYTNFTIQYKALNAKYCTLHNLVLNQPVAHGFSGYYGDFRKDFYSPSLVPDGYHDCPLNINFQLKCIGLWGQEATKTYHDNVPIKGQHFSPLGQDPNNVNNPWACKTNSNFRSDCKGGAC
jgi:hypothetical protein